MLEGCLEGVQPRGSDVDVDVDHWVVLVLEEIEDAQKVCTHTGCPAKHLETRPVACHLRQKIFLGPLCKVLAMLIDLGGAVVG